MTEQEIQEQEIQEQKIQDVIEDLKSMSVEARLDVILSFCPDCGKYDASMDCQCIC